jgi:hypothetical protein
VWIKGFHEAKAIQMLILIYMQSINDTWDGVVY